MIEHGLYIIKKEYFELLESIGCECDKNDGEKRPVYCCFKDNKIADLYWAIPTSDFNHREKYQIEKFYNYTHKSLDDLRSCYYYIGFTTKKAVYKISSCFPIIDKYIDHEFTSNGTHVIIKNKKAIHELDIKLRRILAFENNNNNYFPQHITDIKNALLKELNKE